MVGCCRDERAGSRTVLILPAGAQTVQSTVTKGAVSPDYVAHDVLDAVHWVLDPLGERNELSPFGRIIY